MTILREYGPKHKPHGYRSKSKYCTKSLNAFLTHLLLGSFLIIVVDEYTNATIFLIRDFQSDHAQNFHILQSTIPATGERDFLLHSQMYTNTQ